MEATIRPANSADASKLADIRVLLFQTVGELLDEEAAKSAYTLFQNGFLSMLTEGSYLAWIVEVDNKIAATGGANRFQKLPYPANPSGKSLYVLNMFTYPEYRGRGFSALILDAIKSFAQSEGIPRLFLENSDAGKPIYLKYGFHEKPNEMEFYF